MFVELNDAALQGLWPCLVFESPQQVAWFSAWVRRYIISCCVNESTLRCDSISTWTRMCNDNENERSCNNVYSSPSTCIPSGNSWWAPARKQALCWVLVGGTWQDSREFPCTGLWSCWRKLRVRVTYSRLEVGESNLITPIYKWGNQGRLRYLSKDQLRLQPESSACHIPLLESGKSCHIRDIGHFPEENSNCLWGADHVSETWNL